MTPSPLISPGKFPFPLLRRAGHGSVPPPVDPLLAFYGTGIGQVPLDLRPANAVLDGSGNVISVPNLGGAGPSLDVTANTTGLTLSGGRFSVPSTTVYLLLPAPINMVGLRLFMLMQIAGPAPTSGTTSFAGRSGSSADDGRNTLRYDWANKRFQALRYSWDGTTGTTTTTAIAPNAATPLTAAEALIELEFSGGFFRSWIDGVSTGQVAFSFPSFSVDRFFSAHASPFFTGLAGSIRALVVGDGSADLSSQIAAIRANYGR